MNRKPVTGFLLRLLACVLALASLVLFFASRTFPAVPLQTVFGWVMAGVMVLGSMVTVAFHLTIRWQRWCLSQGTTDPQWMIFGGEQPALQPVRSKSDSGRRRGPQGI